MWAVAETIFFGPGLIPAFLALTAIL